MMENTINFLENCDLNPKFREEKKGSRNPIAGIITLLYFPLLLLYLYMSITPQYTPLPSCCVCANSKTLDSSWVYLANDESCSRNSTCRLMVQNELKSNCDAALQYRILPDENVTVSIQDIGCMGLKPGDSCDENCLDVSSRWATNLDYTYPDNRYQATIRCPIMVGACDFKATYSAAETTPHAVCRYPELGRILSILGTALGLLNGILITFRLMIRAFWNRIGMSGVSLNGGLWDYWRGVIVGLLFNYFGIIYLTLAPNINKRQRYGGQLSIGFLILFFTSPFVVYLIIIFNSFWTPMAILLTLTISAVAIIIRTVYNLIRLEIHSRNCIVLSQEMINNHNPLSSSAFFEENSESIFDENSNNLADEGFNYIPPRRIKPVVNTNWSDFFTGFYLNFISLYYLIVKKSFKRYTGMKSGYYCSISILAISVIWSLLFGLNGWSNITFNFPFVPKQLEFNFHTNTTTSPNDASSTIPNGSNTDSASGSTALEKQITTTHFMLKIAVLQSVYFIISWSLIMTFVLHFTLFLKYLPEKNRFFIPWLIRKKPLGKKVDYRFGFIVSLVPLFLSFFFFFYYKFIPFVTVDLPATQSQCSFPAWTLIIPISGIAPSLILVIFAKSERFRWGIISAIGASLLLFGIGCSILLFYYCVGPTQTRYYPMAWFISLVGTWVIVYSSIRPDIIYTLEKKKDQHFEEERLLNSNILNQNPQPNINNSYIDYQENNNYD